jgi:hypothetical protein
VSNNHNNNNNNNNNKKRKGEQKSKDNNNNKKVKVLAKCPHCGKMGTHKPEECRENPNNKPTTPGQSSFKKKSVTPNTTPKVNAMQAEEATEEAGEESDFEQGLDDFLAQIRGE